MPFPQAVTDLFTAMEAEYTELAQKGADLTTAQTEVAEAEAQLNAAREAVNGPQTEVFAAKQKLQTTIGQLVKELGKLTEAPLPPPPEPTPEQPPAE